MLTQINHAVLRYSCMSMRNQSWMNLLFSVSWDLILDSNLDSLLSILNSRRNPESWIKSRIETHCTDCKPTFKRYRKISALKKLPILLINVIPFPVFVLDDPHALTFMGAPPEEIYTCQGFWYYICNVHAVLHMQLILYYKLHLTA